MQYLGDYAEDYATLNFKFSTHTAAGTPATLSGSPAISVYKANGTTQSTAGVTLSVDFDSVTGLNNVLIDLSADAFYETGDDYQVVITAGTVDSVSVVGTVLAHFSIENRFNEVNVTAISGDSAAADNLESACDNYSATRGLAGTALPNAAADAAGGLPISDAGALDLDTQLATLTNGTYGLSAIENLVDDIESRLTATRAGYLDNLSGGAVALASGVTVATNNDKTGYALSSAGVSAVQSGLSTLTAQQVWEYTTRTLSSFGTLVADTVTAVWGAVARTITGGTITTVSDKTGYSLTVTPPTAAQVRAEIDSNSTQLAAIVADTAEIQAELADGGRTDLLIDGIKAKTDQLTFTTPNSVDATATVSTAGLATEANQTTIINHLTDVKGATFSGATDSLEAIRNRGDVAWITGGTGGGSNAVTINVKDDGAANVVDCYVEIWDSAGTSFISRTNTNSSGNVTFNLDSNTYIVKMHKTGYYFANQTLVVDGVESEAYTGTILTPDAATDPTLCRIYGYYFDPAGAAYSAVKSLIKLTAIYEASDNNYYTSELVGTYNTTTGLLYFDVIQGASVTLEIPILNVKKSFVVPATTLYKISDIA